MRTGRTIRQLGICFTLISGTAFPGVAQQQLPAPLREGQTSEVPVAIQIARWRMLDGDINALTFHSMDTLFTTRAVPRSGPVWQLPREDRKLDFTYQFEGATYSADQFFERTFTNALLVMKDGKIIAEVYRNNNDERTRFIGWSMTKSITSILIGCALSEGRIKSLDDMIVRYLPELEAGGYNGVTIRQIMQMRSGVDYEERYDFDKPGTAARNHISSLVKNVTRFVDAARTVKRIHAPGAVFQYKTLDTAVLGWLIERVSGGSTVSAYTAQRLWEPLRAEQPGFYIMDGPPGTGREFSGAGFNATLRDYARLGQMMLNGGSANGHQIIWPEWVKESTSNHSSTGSRRGGYGLQWWLLGNQSAYSAIGLQGQFIYVDPRSKTVIVKISYFPPGNETAAQETAAFMEAASRWTIR